MNCDEAHDLYEAHAGSDMGRAYDLGEGMHLDQNYVTKEGKLRLLDPAFFASKLSRPKTCGGQKRITLNRFKHRRCSARCPSSAALPSQAAVAS